MSASVAVQPSPANSAPGCRTPRSGSRRRRLGPPVQGPGLGIRAGARQPVGKGAGDGHVRLLDDRVRCAGEQRVQLSIGGVYQPPLASGAGPGRPSRARRAADRRATVRQVRAALPPSQRQAEPFPTIIGREDPASMGGSCQASGAPVDQPSDVLPGRLASVPRLVVRVRRNRRLIRLVDHTTPVTCYGICSITTVRSTVRLS